MEFKEELYVIYSSFYNFSGEWSKGNRVFELLLVLCWKFGSLARSKRVKNLGETDVYELA